LVNVTVTAANGTGGATSSDGRGSDRPRGKLMCRTVQKEACGVQRFLRYPRHRFTECLPVTTNPDCPHSPTTPRHSDAHGEKKARSPKQPENENKPKFRSQICLLHPGADPS
jgi:hypothetical protein